MEHPGTLVLIMALAVLAPLLGYATARWLPVPVVIFEIVLGVLVGPDALGWAHHDQVIDTLSDLGLSMLIFLAGYEIRFAEVRGDTLRRAGGAWVLSFAAGLGVALLLSGADLAKSLVVGTALTSTALGAVLPILRDSGRLDGRFGSVVMAFGSVGEFGPIIAMALLFSGRSPGAASVVLAVFAVVTAGAVFWAMRPRPPWFARIVAVTLHSSGQFAVRFVMLLLAGMLGLAHVFGLDTLLGAFAAGMLTRLVLQGAVPERSDAILERVEAIGFGFLVPFFYIVTGIDFDLAALLDGGRPLALLPVFLLLFLLVRGAPAYLLAPRDLTGRAQRAALGFFSSTCLPLVVAITAIGLDDQVIGAGESAALVAAAMLSVLVFPLLAFRLLRREEDGGSRAAPGRDAESGEAW
ncbi:cation:proton antiporter [Streptomyces sp. RB110-1]|uniref:cation:proton antiporter n=1 Tax=unclassified Streptomyces TaxID=2593676 RepID=UPI001902A7F7|nr:MULTISPECIES: cation:proton antiporter [unclassified Streptomyces]MBK0375951.1 cation:proton antiporter [Streptomyces sp. RB110-1]MBK0387675.1 cation:proton antiporter [Streptomyces sp. RB110-2]